VLIAFVAGIALLILVVVAFSDIVLARERGRTVGETLQTWAARHQLFAVGGAALIGAVLGHFFWQ
jgi:hypothetical protein